MHSKSQSNSGVNDMINLNSDASKLPAALKSEFSDVEKHISTIENNNSDMILKKKWLTITDRTGITFLDFGVMEIWDGTDMALLRETIAELIEVVGVRSLAINLKYVKYIPSGFFGMMFDWQEKHDVTFHLFSPQPNVRNMLWFQRFLQPLNAECFLLRSEPCITICELEAEQTSFPEEAESETEVCSSSYYE